jgi:hypothetical protein
MDKEETEKEGKQCDCKDCGCKNCDCRNCDCKGWRHHHHHYHGGGGGGGALYGFGFIGALFYFLQHAVTANDYLWGILKAIVWPALAVFKLLTIWKI